MSHLAVVIVL